MLNDYKILTVTHQNMSVDEIRHFIVQHDSKDELKHKLHQLKADFELEELFYLATCNRVIYFFKTAAYIDAHFQYNFIKHVNEELTAAKIEKGVQLFEGVDALKHFFAVAASTKSMVIGERQILRQIREGYEQSKAFGLTADAIRIAVDTAVVASKDVYSNTRIGEKPVSVASLASQKLLQFHLAKDARILLIGAGQTNLLVSKFLKKHHFDNVTVFNRTPAKAEDLAELIGGTALPLSDLSTYNQGFDCLIVCTGSVKPILDKKLYSSLLNGETDRKLVIDLAIPNNVDKTMLPAFDLEYVEVEDIRELANKNLAFRAAEVDKAQEIIETYVEEFPKLYQQRQIEVAMRKVPAEIKAIKDHAMNTLFKEEVEDLDEKSRDLLVRMMTYMEKRCIGIPMKAAREAVL